MLFSGWRKLGRPLAKNSPLAFSRQAANQWLGKNMPLASRQMMERGCKKCEVQKCIIDNV